MATAIVPADKKQIASCHAPSSPISQQPQKKEKENSRKESLSGAVARAAFGSLAFLFRLPIRLFRPVKLSSWTVLESFAKRENKKLSLKYILRLFRRENNGFIFHLLGPPILANTLIGFCLFEGYSFAEARLLKAFYPQLAGNGSSKRGTKAQWTPLWIVAFSGGFAGAAQCLISAPLDNVRLVLTSQQQKVKKRGGHTVTHAPTISWRSIIRAAILPFAPSTRQHTKLVKAMSTASADTAVQSIRQQSTVTTQGRNFFSSDQKKAVQRVLRNVSGGIHGAGLLMSLARDSVGFASFFFFFEVSRRVAHGTSLSIDRVIAWFSTSAALPTSKAELDVDQDGSGAYKPTTINADFSYNASRTKTGRVVAALVLITGGGLGALCYELVGRPFELMRLVIWTGRRKWQAALDRQKRSRAGTRSRRHHIVLAAQAPKFGIRRLNSSMKLRPTNSTGSKLSRIQTLMGPNHPPRPHRRLASPDEGRNTATKVREHLQPESKASPQCAQTASRPPSAISLLIEHAAKTSTLAYTSSSRKFRTTVPNSILLAHTYFIAPYIAPFSVSVDDAKSEDLSKTTKKTSPSPSSSGEQGFTASATAKSANQLLSKWTNSNPVSSSTKFPSGIFKRHGRAISVGAHKGLTYLPPRPRSAPGSIATSTLAQRWGSGRVAWALKRLASPYAVGFFAFAVMSGEV